MKMILLYMCFVSGLVFAADGESAAPSLGEVRNERPDELNDEKLEVQENLPTPRRKYYKSHVEKEVYKRLFKEPSE